MRVYKFTVERTYDPSNDATTYPGDSAENVGTTSNGQDTNSEAWVTAESFKQRNHSPFHGQNGNVSNGDSSSNPSNNAEEADGNTTTTTTTWSSASSTTTTPASVITTSVSVPTSSSLVTPLMAPSLTPTSKPTPSHGGTSTGLSSQNVIILSVSIAIILLCFAVSVILLSKKRANRRLVQTVQQDL